MQRQSGSRVDLRGITQKDWPLIEKLFGEKGACGGCWCMLWRSPKGGRYFEERKGSENKKALRTLLKNGRLTGLLAVEDKNPVGWLSIGPKEDFPYFDRTRVLDHASKPKTWSISCFYILPKRRGLGLATTLVRKACLYAQGNGARFVEGYPVFQNSQSGQIPAVFAWTGVPEIFENAGFLLQQRPPPKRSYYLLKI